MPKRSNRQVSCLQSNVRRRNQPAGVFAPIDCFPHSPQLEKCTAAKVTDVTRANSHLRGTQEAGVKGSTFLSSKPSDEVSHAHFHSLGGESKIARPPDSLPHMDSAEMQECFVALEQMKMLMSELEVNHCTAMDRFPFCWSA